MIQLNHIYKQKLQVMIPNFTKYMRVFVFDMDGTLFHRSFEKIKNLQQDFKSNGRFIYLRPNLHHLIYNFDRLSQHSMLILWTSMQRKNAIKIKQYLEKLGLKFGKLYTQQHCNQNLSKNLQVVANDLQIDVKNIYLIDDSPQKVVNNQNYIKISTYQGTVIQQNPNKEQDNEILRIVKQLYKISGIMFSEQLIQQANLMALDYKFNKLSLNKEKYIQKHSHKNDNTKKLKYKPKIQKTQNIEQNIKNNHQIMEQVQRVQTIIEQQAKIEQVQHKKFTQITKVIVFDLSKTLITKRKQLDNQIQHLRNASKIQGSIIYNRPHLEILQTFINAHEHQHDIKLIVWSTMRGKKVQQNCKGVVNNFGVKFEDVINGVEGVGKDLKQICKKYGCNLQNTILVDDSAYKRVQNQNYIQIVPYLGDKSDIQLIRIVKKLDQFIKCNNQQCQVKLELKKYQKQLQVAQRLYQQFRQKIEHEQKTKTNQIKVEQRDSQQRNGQKRQKRQKIKNFKQKEISNQEKLKRQEKIRLKKQQQQKHKIDRKTKLKVDLNSHQNEQQKVKIKCIVFDINQTLITRTEKKLPNIEYCQKNKYYCFYARPHLDKLVQFLSSNPQLTVCLWSTISNYNCQPFLKILESKGFKYKKMYNKEQLRQGRKNLQCVSKQFQIPLQNILLVDDNSEKRVLDQKFIQISPYDPSLEHKTQTTKKQQSEGEQKQLNNQLSYEDDSLLYLVQQLRKII